MYGFMSPNFSELKDIDPNDFTKVVKVSITCKDSKGRTIIKTLEGAEASRWHKWLIQVCFFASKYEINPTWQSLKWVIKNG